MTLTGVKYNNVQESFEMGGPYIGELEFHGKLVEGKFLADGEKLSQDKSKLVFSQHLGFYNKGFLGLKTIREFRILVYDENTNSFFRSKTQYEALAIEKMKDDIITFHIAFHTEIDSYKRTIVFNEMNFNKVEIS